MCVSEYAREKDFYGAVNTVNLRAYWLLSNYAETRRRFEKQSLMCDPTGSTDSSPVIAPQQIEFTVLTFLLWVQNSLKLSKGWHPHPPPHTHTRTYTNTLKLYILCGCHWGGCWGSRPFVLLIFLYFVFKFFFTQLDPCLFPSFSS